MTYGRKTGGRKAGTPNRRTLALAQILVIRGEQPGVFLARVMHSKSPKISLADKISAAKALLPFCYARCSALPPEQVFQPTEIEDTVVRFEDFVPKRLQMQAAEEAEINDDGSAG